MKRIPFIYAVNTTLTALGSDSKQLDIAADSEFELRKITSAQTGDFTVQFVDPEVGKLSNIAIYNRNLAGKDNYYGPGEIEEPHVFARRSSITVDFVDLSNAGNTVQLALHGFKIKR